MGELIHVSEFQKTRSNDMTKFLPAARQTEWYFPKLITVTSACYSTSVDWKATILSQYPEQAAIHWDIIEETPAIRIEGRRFVRDSCAGDVIAYNEDLSYRYRSSYERSGGGRSYYMGDVRHGYMLFFFETSADATLFGLRFAEFISSVGNRHPTRKVSEADIQDAIDHPYN